MKKSEYQYKKQIDNLNNKIKDLNNEIEDLSNEIKSLISIYLYIQTANAPENSLYKIGRTKDLTKRLQSHQSSLAEDIEILFYLETDDAKTVESCIKNFAKKFQYRKYKEVYEVNINILKSLAIKCEKIKLDIEDEQKLSKMEDDKNKKYYINISKIYKNT